MRNEAKEDRVQWNSNNQVYISLVCTSVFQLQRVGKIVGGYVSIRKSEQKLEKYTDCQRKSIFWAHERLLCDTCHYEFKQGETTKPLL